MSEQGTFSKRFGDSLQRHIVAMRWRPTYESPPQGLGLVFGLYDTAIGATRSQTELGRLIGTWSILKTLVLLVTWIAQRTPVPKWHEACFRHGGLKPTWST